MADDPEQYSDALLGFGTIALMRAAPDAAALTELGEVTNVGLPNEQTDKKEVTHYRSPGRTREFISGLIDPGDMPLEINWIPGNPTDDLLTAAKADGKRRIMRVVPPGGQMYTFPVIVTSKAPAIPIDDKMTCAITLAIAGAVVQAPVVDDPTVIG